MPDYELTPVYPGLTGVYVSKACIGVVVASREWRSDYKRVFFCCETSFCYYGHTEKEAVDAYMNQTYA